MSDERATLLRLLAELGVTEQDYDDIERAKAIVHEVNLRLWKRRAPTRYDVLSSGGPPDIVWGLWDREAAKETDGG